MTAGSIQCNGVEHVEKLFTTNTTDRDAGIARMRSGSNAGLVFDRYLDVWKGFSVVDGKDRYESLARFAADFNARTKVKNAHVHTLLKIVHERQSRAVKTRNGASFSVKLASRFATGLGGFHPTEVGFAFERITGVPYLPGSSVKGLARAAATFDDEPLREELLGPDRIDKESDAKTGDLVFLDAYPNEWPQLAVDIINCHHQNYYADKGAPLESDDPIPVYFLTVAPGTTWTFRILSRSRQHAERGAQWLKDGLKLWGAGAKTAVGYGMFAD